LELRQLKYFARIVDLGSITRASQSLHVAQPALSLQVSKLEEELGVQLLTRSVRGVIATEAGAAVYRHAQAILRQIDATQLIAAQADGGPAGPVTIGLPWTVTAVIGLALLKEVTTTLPSVLLEVVEGPSSVLAQMLAEGKLDLAVVFDNTIDGGLLMKPVVYEPLLFVGAYQSLAGLRDCTLADAVQKPWLMLSRPNGIREAIERVLAEQDLKSRVVAEINAPRLLIEAVVAGIGFSILPSCAMDEHLRTGKLDAIPLEGGNLGRTVYLSNSRVFAQTRASEYVYVIVERLMREAVREGRWNAKWIGMDGTS
jgi:LysR family nitrogen assimilation transcriptional regulator